VKKEKITEGLLVIVEMIAGLHQDSNDEMIIRVRTVKKVGLQKKHLVLKKSLVVTKKNPSKNLQKNFKDLEHKYN